MKVHTQDIDPSEDDREKMMEMLKFAMSKTKAKEVEFESMVKGNKKNLDPETKHEAEVEVKRCRRNSETLEDVMAKSEFTRGHTLKKAYGKKTMHILKDSMTDDKYKSMEELLHNNGLA